MEASRAGKTAVLEQIKSQHESGLTWENPEEARELKYSNLIDIFLWAITEVEILGEEKELQQKSGVVLESSSDVPWWVSLQNEVLKSTSLLGKARLDLADCLFSTSMLSNTTQKTDRNVSRLSRRFGTIPKFIDSFYQEIGLSLNAVY